MSSNADEDEVHQDSSQSVDNSVALLQALQERANNLLADLRAYQACLQAHGKQSDVEIRIFKRGIESEAKTLNAVTYPTDQPDQTLADDEIEKLESKRIHALRSANLPFYEAVWNVARQCRGIVALGKRVYCEDKKSIDVRNGSANGRSSRRDKYHRPSAVVDIVAEDGLEWIKVSTITEKRLLFEMAKEGWEGYGDRSDSDEYDSNDGNGLNGQKDEASQLELVKLAKVLCRASRESRVRYKHPKVYFILSKVQEGVYDDVDAVIADIRSIGITVKCANSTSASNELINRPDDITQPLQSLSLTSSPQSQTHPDLQNPPKTNIAQLLPSRSSHHPPPTPTLNIDCTILLALISDISHIHETSLPPHPYNHSGTYHKAITRQIHSETTHPLLPAELYPLLGARDLFCTSHAAQRMREIVLTMGTENEKARAGILLGEDGYVDSPAEILREALRGQSCHEVPQDLGLPIRVVDPDSSETVQDDAKSLSAADQRILAKLPMKMNLSSINKSVFLYGWRKDVVTVTSNRVVALGIVKALNEILDAEEGGVGDGLEKEEEEAGEFYGPRIYVCETARSLIGKEKGSGLRF